MTNEEKTNKCPLCGSENVYGISRIVGYFSIIDNWNNSKKSELKRRQRGNNRVPDTNGDVLEIDKKDTRIQLESI